MTTIKEAAMGYKPKAQLKNIAELHEVPVDISIETETRKDNDGEDYDVSFVSVNGENYRVPDSVLRDLKALVEKMPTLKKFTVVKTGSGMGTKYQTVPALG